MGEGALEGLRVLELGHGIAGPYAARLLGDVGATVIKVEEPGNGDRSRSFAPIADGESLLFNYLNFNKRALECDLSHPASLELLEGFVRKSDIVIENFRPGKLDEWGCGYNVMRRWNESIVLTSITNFGQSGPYAAYEATDLTLYAMGGMMGTSGKRYPRPPLKHGIRQTLYWAGLTGAYASLAAYRVARLTGVGHHVDVSIHACVASGLTNPTARYVFQGTVPEREGELGDPLRGVPVPTRDGFVVFSAGSVGSMEDYAEALGIEELRDEAYASAAGRAENAEKLMRVLCRRFGSQAAKDVFVAAAQAGIVAGYVQGAEALLANEQLAARDAFRVLPARPGEAAAPWRYPFEIAHLSETPGRIRVAAPRLGEHTSELVAEVSGAWRRASGGNGHSKDGRRERFVNGVKARLPLDGLRVLDLTQILAGPYLSALLADLGAEVIKIEGPDRPDLLRREYSLAIDNHPGTDPWNRSATFNMNNRGKLSFVCDMKSGEGRAALRKLLEKSDIVVENFTPGILGKWGFGPVAMREINPRLVIFSNSGFGGTGPQREFRGQGATLEFLMGIGYFTGYAGEGPSKAHSGAGDYPAIWAGLLAIMAAIIRRDRTGLGQWIDQSMLQSGAPMIPEAILHFQVYRAELERNGNEELTALVSGAFETREEDSWLTLSVRDWSQLVVLASVIPGIGDALDRRRSGDLTRATGIARDAIASWATTVSAKDGASALQAVGIAAGAVVRIDELLFDRQLLEREFYEAVDHGGDIGLRPLIGRPFKIDGEDGWVPRVTRRAPKFGEHNQYVLRDLLGMDDDQVAALYAKGVVCEEPAGLAGNVPPDVTKIPDGKQFRTVDRKYRERLASIYGRT